jgi:hypothetical protein
VDFATPPAGAFAGAGNGIIGSMVSGSRIMGAYAKTATGEKLTYRPSDLRRYEGEPFCLRVTPEDIDLERCFFVYLDEKFEGYSLRRLFQTYFDDPKSYSVDEMEYWMERWQRIDPMLKKKYALLRQMIAKVHACSGKVLFYINHGPGPVDLDDSVGSHLGTSVFADGSFDDKILDLVLEFHAEDESFPELDQWARFPRTSTAGAIGPTSRVRRRRIITILVAAVVGVFTLPFMLFSCRGRNNGGGGFGGGML